MFGKPFFSDFEDDPFFSGHNERFSDPIKSLTYESQRGEKHDRAVEKRREDPFSNMFSSMMRMDDMFDNMRKQMRDVSNDDNIHSFTSSSVMTYRHDGKGDPKIFQASSSTRRAPGRIREDRKALRDSETGIEKMAIGHHIADRGKVVQRHRNMKHGSQFEEEKNFYHMAEDEEADFDNEWKKKTSNLNYTLGGGSYNQGNKAIGKPQQRKETKRAIVKTPAAGALRPAGPSKSGRSKY